MTLNDFWPLVDDDHTTKCLPNEAEAAADEVFLAVHQPMSLTREFFSAQKGQFNVQTEQQVLDALLVSEPPSGTLVLPIVGDSGVGKSHMIRWLGAHLRLRADRHKRHVVRIPKSSSLRGVLQLILEGLPSKRYEELHQKLRSARVPPSRSEAMRLLQAKLLFALEEEGKAAAQRLQTSNSRNNDRDRKSHCSPQGLMSLLQDPAIQHHFTAHEGEPEMWGVLTRIADRCLHGSRKHDAGPLNQFLDADFKFIHDVPDASLARITKQYLPVLKKPAELEKAINFLNEVVDQALAGLVDLGGISLTDVFIDIRKAMLADNIELVLLVEDFAVLAGIQGPLLDAMIREAIRDGKRELCTMRTALAVTEGKLPETVKTRAQSMWKINSHPFTSEEQAMEAFENFVGGYLNAARWGAKKLGEVFEQRSDETSLSDWVPNFYEVHHQYLSEQEKEQLRAFDFSPRGNHPLFPLNRGAVRQLARKYLRVDETYKFDPRELINRLVRDTVIHHRGLWEQGNFPPGDFNNFDMNALDVDVSTHLRSKTSDADHKRIAALVYFWGDDPRSHSEAAALNVKIYEAFRLKSLDWQAKPQIRVRSPELPTNDRREITKALPEAPDALGRWRDILDEWRSKKRLGQTDANVLRGFLAKALLSWLDADALLLKKISIENKEIGLPRVDQGVQSTFIAVAARDEDLNDDKKSDAFFAAMRAVARYNTVHTWDYEGGETDAVRYAALIGRMAKQAEEHFVKRGSGKTPAEALKPLAQALLVGARLLNLEGASASANADQLAAMLNAGSSDSNEPMDPSDRWTTIKRRALQVRGDLRNALLEQVSARQGGGEKELAVDAARLLEAVKELRDNQWHLPKDLDSKLFSNLSESARQHLRELRDFLPGILEARRTLVQKWRIEVVEALGEDFDMPSVTQNVRETIKEAVNAGVYRCRDLSPDTLRSRFNELGPIRETLKFAENACRENADFGATLSALAQLDEKCMSKVNMAVRDYARFLNETSLAVAEQMKDAPPDIDEMTRSLDREFENLSENWNHIIGS